MNRVLKLYTGGAFFRMSFVALNDLIGTALKFESGFSWVIDVAPPRGTYIYFLLQPLQLSTWTRRLDAPLSRQCISEQLDKWPLADLSLIRPVAPLVRIAFNLCREAISPPSLASRLCTLWLFSIVHYFGPQFHVSITVVKLAKKVMPCNEYVYLLLLSFTVW